MASLNFAEIKLKDVTPQAKTITYNNQKIEVKQWLPIMDRYNLIMVTLQQSKENGVYNPVKLDMYFSLNLIYKFSNIIFSAEEHLNADDTFDKLNTSGLMDAVLNAIPAEAKELLYDNLMEMKTKLEQANLTIGGVIQSLIDIAPDAGERMNKILETFDKEKFQEVIQFAQAANGGNPISAGQK